MMSRTSRGFLARFMRWGGAWLCLAAVAMAVEPLAPLSLDECLRPYAGPVAPGIDSSTLEGKVMCGYQGWFSHPKDGYNRGTGHWGNCLGVPPTVSVELWPDLREYGSDELYPTNLVDSTGSPAVVFSSANRNTVLRHFKWMKDYGIGGAFVQRFASAVGTEQKMQFVTAVLNNCREGANTYGRTFAVMYDMGFDASTCNAVRYDWGRLVHDMHITESPAYQLHQGRPLIALWGYRVGKRKFDADAVSALFKFLREPANGGCSIMLGTAGDWRMLPPDEGGNLLDKVDIISRWAVGSFSTPEAGEAWHEREWTVDLKWCQEHRKDYYPVVFPGFSWHNLWAGRGEQRPLNQIPRLGGAFFWRQIQDVKRMGMNKAYVAMFDEIDEGTAIFKCTNSPPAGEFLTYEGLPSDAYLKLAGAAQRLFAHQTVDDKMPDVSK